MVKDWLVAIASHEDITGKTFSSEELLDKFKNDENRELSLILFSRAMKKSIERLD